MQWLARFNVLRKVAGSSSRVGDSQEMKKEGCDRRLLMGNTKRMGGRRVV